MILRLLLNRNFSHISKRTMKIIPIPANADNYQYLIVDEKTEKTAVVDPVDIASVVSLNGEKLIAGLVTHHHWDHAAGYIFLHFFELIFSTEELAKEFAPKGLKIYGGDGSRIKSLDYQLNDQENFQIGDLKVRAIHTPCHTSTHICYYVEDESKNERAVFTGDTLFIGGCGRFFEGSPEQMHEALNNRLAKLPGDTKVYCGHEYTVNNLKFAKSIEPNNEYVTKKLQWAEQQIKNDQFTIPSTIDEEKTFNPFMRVSEKAIQEKLGLTDPIKVMAKLRELKNSF